MNFVFPRRYIQQALDRLYGVLTPVQVDAFVDALNEANHQRLPKMWEVMVLDALAQVHPVEHEAPLENGRKPDFGIKWEHEGRDYHVVGDVTAVSDRSYEEANPYRWLSEEIFRLCRKYDMSGNGIRLQVEGKRVGPSYMDSKITLALPKKAELQKIIADKVEPFIRTAARDRLQPHSLKVTGEAEFTIAYNPGQRFAGGGFPAYNVAASLVRNPLWTALREKAKQLKSAPADAIRIVVLCDGSSGVLRNLNGSSGPSNFSAKQIVTAFLDRTSSIDLVLGLTVKSDAYFGGSTKRLDCALWAAVPPKRHPRLTEPSIEAVQALLQQALAKLPTPTLDALNAATFCMKPGHGADGIGGYKMSGSKVSLSARAIQRFLAGEISAEKFDDAHGWNEHNRPSNPFLRAKLEGRMITKVEVQHVEGKDDDMIEFTFGDPDPANGPFLKRSGGNS